MKSLDDPDTKEEWIDIFNHKQDLLKSSCDQSITVKEFRDIRGRIKKVDKLLFRCLKYLISNFERIVRNNRELYHQYFMRYDTFTFPICDFWLDIDRDAIVVRSYKDYGYGFIYTLIPFLFITDEEGYIDKRREYVENKNGVNDDI